MVVLYGCFQCVKGNKFESDSQQILVAILVVAGCFQCVKGNKFESDSQLHETKYVNDSRCFQCVKGNKFESDSQLPPFTRTKEKVVSNVSKVINLKAIHNVPRVYQFEKELFPMCQR